MIAMLLRIALALAIASAVGAEARHLWAHNTNALAEALK